MASSPGIVGLGDNCGNTSPACCQSRQPSRQTSVSARDAALGQPGPHDVGGGGPELPAGRRPHVPRPHCRRRPADRAASGGSGARRGRRRRVAEAANTENGPGGLRPRRCWLRVIRAVASRRRGGRLRSATGPAGELAFSCRELGRVLSSGICISPRRSGKFPLPRLKFLDVELVPVGTIEAYAHSVAAPWMATPILYFHSRWHHGPCGDDQRACGPMFSGRRKAA